MIIKELEYLFHKIPDYQITPFLGIKHPTYKEILEYGEDKYITLLYILCSTPDDLKSELFDVGYNWYEVDLVTWFYIFIIPQIKASFASSNIIFNSDITMYELYENTETKEKVLYNPMLKEVLTKENLIVIKEHLNSMIGNLYKDHREIPASEITKKILIEEDRQRKRLNRNKESCWDISIKNIILARLFDKFHNSDIYGVNGVREKCGLSKDDNSISLTADNAFMLGEGSVIEKIAEEIYKELKEG